MRLRLPSIAPGVVAFAWALLFGVYVWAFMLGVGVSNALATIVGAPVPAATFVYVRVLGFPGPGRHARRRRP